MKAYDYEAVAYEGEVYCNECLPDDVCPHNRDAHPVFANSEWDAAPVCSQCGAVHDYVTILGDA